MRRALALLLLLIAPAAPADEIDDEISRGLQNLAQIYDIARVLEVRRALPDRPPLTPRNDPWGTPYRIEEMGETYRIVGAGSDRAFDEATWKTSEQFDGTTGDVVFDGGTLTRSNRRWLQVRISVGGGGSTRALEELRRSEVQLMFTREPLMREMTLAKLTATTMQIVGELIAKLRAENRSLGELGELPRDAWGTPLRLVEAGEAARVVSAGADRTFRPESWTAAPQLDLTEDMILENGRFTRRVEDAALLRREFPAVDPLPQPVDRSLHGTGKWKRGAPPIVAPVVLTRLEPRYPEHLRQMRVSGVVVLELAIAETGAVEHIGVLKSVAADMDMSAIQAVRQWTFQPATLDGKPVPVLFNLTVNFKLK
ncbi:MAG TPA: energy transducer TonB [Thermoanaerobaculia bacterium]|nr:energy transducer TonB [Thermoanaerobaculia bacterium]